jgi:hypothetical protein
LVWETLVFAAEALMLLLPGIATFAEAPGEIAPGAAEGGEGGGRGLVQENHSESERERDAGEQRNKKGLGKQADFSRSS